MAGIVRIGLNKIVFNNSTKTIFAKVNIQPVRTITSKLEDLPEKPAPWPYEKKMFWQYHYYFHWESTLARFDQNTKLIVVEGPPAAGKSKFAKHIADSFGMFYLPEANLDMQYTNPYGFDTKTLDPLLPPDCKSFDIKDFLKNPKHKLVARMQIQQFVVRLSQYYDALAHLLSTGQGVVLDRCLYSDFVFAEAMFKNGYLSKKAYKKYYEFRDNNLHRILRPHLVIYLDVPVPKVMENIKKRNISYEVNSQVLSNKYLEEIEKQYKQNYLKEITKHADLLVYDWSVEGDMEIVVEDIEAIDFDRFDIQDAQMKDWDLDDERFSVLRYDYCEKKETMMAFCNIPCYDVPELIVGPLDAAKYHEVIGEAPGNKFLKGYNADMGDENVLFKWRRARETLPVIERRV